MRSARTLGAVALVLVVAGCGSISAADQVRAKVRQFAAATARRDAATLCDQVLAPALVARLVAAGITCQQGMRVFVTSVSHPTIRLSKVKVTGSSASAVVLASASGQTASLETIQLVRTVPGWRLASLASPR